MRPRRANANVSPTLPPIAADDRRQARTNVRRPYWLEMQQDRTTAAIVTSLAPSFPAVDASTRRAVLTDVSSFVDAQIGALPDFLRFPYRIALTGFEWLPVLRWGRRFTALDEERQRVYVDYWSDAQLGLMRNFVKLIRSCALLAYYDHPALQERLNAQVRRARTDADVTNVRKLVGVGLE
jgi:hypothetical protein